MTAAAAPSSLLPAFLSLLAWGAVSSSIILTNKRVYSGGFPFPCALTGVGNGASALAALALCKAAASWRQRKGGAPGALRMRSPREVVGLGFGSSWWWWRSGGTKNQQNQQQQQRQQQRRLSSSVVAAAAKPTLPQQPLLSWWVLPVVSAATALSMALGNVPYLYLSVSFIQMLKASSPAWTLLLAAAAGLETPTAALAGAVGLIAAGTAATVLFQAATAAEEGGLDQGRTSGSSPGDAAFGVALTLLSAVAEAVRVVGSQALLQSAAKQQQQQQQQQEQRRSPRRRQEQPPPPPPLNALESLVYIGGPASLLLLVASLLLREGGSPSGLITAARAFVRLHPLDASLAVASSAAVNLASMLAVRLTSSLTFKVSGCAKNAAVMAFAAAGAQGDKVTHGQAAGYALATSGFIFYAWIKAKASSSGIGGKGGGGAQPSSSSVANGGGGAVSNGGAGRGREKRE